VEDHKAQQLPPRAGYRLEPVIYLDETIRFLSVYIRVTYFGQLYVRRVPQNSLNTRGQTVQHTDTNRDLIMQPHHHRINHTPMYYDGLFQQL